MRHRISYASLQRRSRVVDDSFTGKGQRIEVIDFLRGFAAFVVVLFHFTRGLPIEWLRSVGSYGWLGVEIFFVISGFIIPFSMALKHYSPRKDYAKFISKRVIRLDPPYLAVVVFLVCYPAVARVIPGVKASYDGMSLVQVLCHIAYLNAFVGYPWLNVVFWTLAIEFQFYLVMAMVFAFISHKSWVVRLVFIGLFAGLSFTRMPEDYLPHWTALFSLGIITFWWRTSRVNKWVYIALISSLGLSVIYCQGIDVGLVGILTAVAIAFTDQSFDKRWLWWGTISYSLYLVHVPIGLRVSNFASRFSNSIAIQVFTLLASTVLSVATAHLMYLYIEKPSQALSSRIRY